MKNAITDIRVKNFKSIKDIKLSGLKRINLFIGKPNVGKSNLLEAIGLFSAPYHQAIETKFFQNYIRYDNPNELFFEKDASNNISVETNICNAYIRSLFANNFDFIIINNKKVLPEIELKNNEVLGDLWNRVDKIYNENKAHMTFPWFYRHFTGINDKQGFQIPDINYAGYIKKYSFNNKTTESNPFAFYLLPPYGDNLATILRKNKDVLEFFASSIEKIYGLQLAIDGAENKILFLKKEGFSTVTYPYNLFADTLRRIIFYYCAIESNKDSVLIFEEPEVHSFPPYIKMLAERIAADKENQFFIATHSPYLFENIISKTHKDSLTVHIVDYKNFQTKITKLSPKQISETLDMDVFFNLDKFSK